MKKILLTGSFLLCAGVATVMAQTATTSKPATAAPAATETKSCNKAEKAACCKAGEAKACCSKDKAAASHCAGGSKADATRKEEQAAPKE